MDKKKILLVEDNSDDVLLVQRAFGKSELTDTCSLDVAKDGVEAIRYLQKNHNLPHSPISKWLAMVLLDLKLPKMNGFDVLQHIRSHQNTKLIPVVVFTSSKEERDITKAYSLGANSYIRKPIEFTEFESMLQKIVSYWCDINEKPDAGK